MNRKHAARLLVVLAAAFVAQSCATSYKLPKADQKEVKREAYGSPKDCALVYGSIWVNSTSASVLGLMGVRKDYYVNALQLVQLNTAKPPMVITPARKDEYFFTSPIPVGSSLRVVYFDETEGRTTYMHITRLQGQSPMDLRIDKPGLYYAGSIIYTDKKYAGEKYGAKDGNGYRYDDEDFFAVGGDKEIDALKALLPRYSKTEWEPLIRDRIKELSK